MTIKEEITELEHKIRNYHYLLDILKTRLQEMITLLEKFE